jgi:hypothetical protein
MPAFEAIVSIDGTDMCRRPSRWFLASRRARGREGAPQGVLKYGIVPPDHAEMGPKQRAVATDAACTTIAAPASGF